MNSSFSLHDSNSDAYITSLLDCINRPFDYHPDGRVPDGNPNATMQLVDYYDDNGVSSPVLSTTVPATQEFSGMGVAFIYGQNGVRNATYDMDLCSLRTTALYGPVYFFLDLDGNMINLTGIGSTGIVNDAYFWSNDPVNMLQILGSINGSDTSSALVNSFRVLSAGVRLWPTIEVVTDSSTLAVSRYYGCQMTANSMINTAENQVNVFTVMRNSPSYYEYTNSQGISGRFQPLQEGSVLEPIKLNDLSTIQDDDFSTNGLYFPMIVARTTTSFAVTPNGSNVATFPVRSFFRLIMEGALTQPTPLQATRVPFAPEWADKTKHFIYRNDLYPSIVSGHSFKKVSTALVRVLGASSQIYNLVKSAARTINSMKSTYTATKSVVKAVKPKRRKKQPKKRYVKKSGNQHSQVQHFENQRQTASNDVTSNLAKLLDVD